MNTTNDSQSKVAPDERDTLKGWIAVASAFVSTFICFGVAYGFGAFFDSMATEFGAGKSATSLVFSITTFIFFTGGIWAETRFNLWWHRHGVGALLDLAGGFFEDGIYYLRAGGRNRRCLRICAHAGDGGRMV
mgnify:CR=1 FL=1